MDIYEIFFYVNLGLALCALSNAVALGVLCKKTVFGLQVGLTAIFITAFAEIAFIIQLVMYMLDNAYALYAVFAAFVILCISLIAVTVYCFFLSRRSDKARCIVSGITALLPPLGVFILISLCRRLRRDSAAQKLLYNGYAYTFAALAAYIEGCPDDFIDRAGEEEFERLDKKDAFKHIKALKKAAKTPEGLFEYAEALAYYYPDDIKIAVSAMNKSAKRGCTSALFNLGYWHEVGYYYKKDIKKAREYYKRAADLGDADAKLRLSIAEVKSGNQAEGVAAMRAGAEEGDMCSLFNLALCTERGTGTDKDVVNAASMYISCVRGGIFAAEQKVFALTAKSVNTAEFDDVFRKTATEKFEGEFELVMRGVIAIKEKRACDAADAFLSAVKMRGKWEGVARLLVGSLYLDCGKLENDKKNGAAYIKTAIGMAYGAKDIFLAVPVKLRGKYNERKERKNRINNPEQSVRVEPTVASPYEAFLAESGENLLRLSAAPGDAQKAQQIDGASADEQTTSDTAETAAQTSNEKASETVAPTADKKADETVAPTAEEKANEAAAPSADKKANETATPTADEKSNETEAPIADGKAKSRRPKPEAKVGTHKPKPTSKSQKDAPKVHAGHKVPPHKSQAGAHRVDSETHKTQANAHKTQVDASKSTPHKSQAGAHKVQAEHKADTDAAPKSKPQRKAHEGVPKSQAEHKVPSHKPKAVAKKSETSDKKADRNGKSKNS